MKNSQTNKSEIHIPSAARKILSYFELRARDSFASIANATKCSEQLVKYHFRRYQELGFISECNGVFDPAILGHTLYIVYLSFLGTSTAEEESWMQQCRKKKGVMVVSLTFGKWNGFVAVWAKNHDDLENLLWEVSKPLSGKIAEMQVTTRLNCSYGSTRILDDKYQYISHSAPVPSKPYELRDPDAQILKLLAKNARLSAAYIGKEVGLSANSVQNHIRNLEKHSIILGYRAKYNYGLLGYTQFRLLIRLAENSSDMTMRIMKELFNSGQVIIVSRHLGFSDLDARCYTRTIQDLSKLVAHIRDTFAKSIIQVEVVPFMKLQYVDHLPI